MGERLSVPQDGQSRGPCPSCPGSWLYARPAPDRPRPGGRDAGCAGGLGRRGRPRLPGPRHAVDRARRPRPLRRGRSGRRLLAGAKRLEPARGRSAEGRVMRLARVPWSENVRFALGAMGTHKLRSALTLLGVVAGVATVIMMVSFVVGFNNQVAAAFTTFGTHLFQFQQVEPRVGPGGIPEDERNRRGLRYEDALALKRLSTLVAAVSA